MIASFLLLDKIPKIGNLQRIVILLCLILIMISEILGSGFLGSIVFGLMVRQKFMAGRIWQNKTIHLMTARK